MTPDTFTTTLTAAAAYERHRAQHEGDHPDPDRPDPGDYAGLHDEIYGDIFGRRTT